MKDVQDLAEFLNKFACEGLEGVRLTMSRVGDVEPGQFEAETLRGADNNLLAIELFVHYDD